MNKQDEIRILAENDLESFIRLVHPQRVLGLVHQDLINWWTRGDALSHQMVLLPRDHMKSTLLAYRIAWEITKNPAIRVLYLSSTALLATKQLKFIKDILTSKIYRRYWPDMVHPDEGKREKWTETEIAVDHPKRAEEIIRDPTIITGGMTRSLTGLHCDIAALDDVVVRENAYTEEGREKVRSQYSLLSSIEAADALELVVGTRYFPKDIYNDMREMQVELFDNTGDLIETYSLYEVFEKQVEDQGDGTGEFLWPRQQRYDGKWFGFDSNILARKKAAYLDKTQFRAQYYNDPNDPSSNSINRDLFQYYDQKFLTRDMGKWYYKGNRLNVFAAVDFAYSLAKRADYTCVIVVGVDSEYNYYILDIERFKTIRISDYFDKILRLHQKWDFRKIRAEVTAAQEAIVEELKNSYIRKHGLALSVDKFKPHMRQGSKEERIDAVLRPRYENMQMWHVMGGNFQTLEEELVLQNPAHDDIKDCLAACVDICVPPTGAGRGGSANRGLKASRGDFSHHRFGGIN